jgi:hypothetical protein
MSLQVAVPMEQYRPGISAACRGFFIRDSFTAACFSLIHWLFICTGQLPQMHFFTLLAVKGVIVLMLGSISGLLFYTAPYLNRIGVNKL